MPFACSCHEKLLPCWTSSLNSRIEAAAVAACLSPANHNRTRQRSRNQAAATYSRYLQRERRRRNNRSRFSCRVSAGLYIFPAGKHRQYIQHAISAGYVSYKELGIQSVVVILVVLYYIKRQHYPRRHKANA